MVCKDVKGSRRAEEGKGPSSVIGGVGGGWLLGEWVGDADEK